MSSQDDSLRKLIDNAFPDQQIISHYIVVAEVLTEEGQQLRVVADEGMTPWLACGLLTAAEALVMSQEEEED